MSVTASAEDDRTVTMTDPRARPQQADPTIRIRGAGDTRPRRRRRRPPVHIDQEIELYCNPFVEVYLRLSRHLRKVSQRLGARMAEMALEVQDIIVLRHVFFTASYTLC